MILIVIKLGEDMFYILFSYSYALIFYVKYQESASLLIYSRQAYVYFFMLRRIFDGVGKQIEQYLVKLVDIHISPNAIVYPGGQGDAFLVG